MEPFHNRIRIEDNFEDVLMKAAAGLGIGNLDLAERAGIPVERVRALLSGRLLEADLAKVAQPLGLHAPSLLELARRVWRPGALMVNGLNLFNSPYPVPGYEEMTVNCYLVEDPQSGEAVVFDSGADASGVLAAIQKKTLSIKLVLLTHAHGDHVKALDELLAGTGNPPVWIHEREPVKPAATFTPGKRFQLASLEIETRPTDGHSPGGTSYVIRGLEQPVAIVGDSLFCLSQGGARGAYHRALKNNRDQILSLPDETVLCPGHGPLTTVAWEKARNPFFPEFKEP